MGTWTVVYVIVDDLASVQHLSWSAAQNLRAQLNFAGFEAWLEEETYGLDLGRLDRGANVRLDVN